MKLCLAILAIGFWDLSNAFKHVGVAFSCEEPQIKKHDGCVDPTPTGDPKCPDYCRDGCDTMQMTFYLDDWVSAFEDGEACPFNERQVCNTTDVELCEKKPYTHTHSDCAEDIECTKIKRYACEDVTVSGCKEIGFKENCTTELIEIPKMKWQVINGEQVWVPKKPREYLSKSHTTCIEEFSEIDGNFTYPDCIKELEDVINCEHIPPKPEKFIEFLCINKTITDCWVECEPCVPPPIHTLVQKLRVVTVPLAVCRNNPDIKSDPDPWFYEHCESKCFAISKQVYDQLKQKGN